MPAEKEIDNAKSINKLGIIAGGGSLPSQLVAACRKKNIEPYIVGIEGQTNEDLKDDNQFLWTHLGSAGKIIKYFRSHDVKDLVMIGHIKRPAFNELKPDLKAVQIISRIGMKALGDNGLLTALKSELEREGFKLHGIHKFCDGLLVREGIVGSVQPKPEDQASIERGIVVSQGIGHMDVGQSVIIQNGIIIGVEAIEGTDNLISRCKPLLKKGRGGILVKTCKPNQDKDLDLPTIGVQTVENAYQSGLVGIVIQAEHVIMTDPKAIAECADKYKIFVTGVTLKEKTFEQD